MREGKWEPLPSGASWRRTPPSEVGVMERRYGRGIPGRAFAYLRWQLPRSWRKRKCGREGEEKEPELKGLDACLRGRLCHWEPSKVFEWEHLTGFTLEFAQAALGFPGCARGKEPACQSRRCKRRGFDPWVGKIPWGREPTLLLWLGKSHGQRSLAGYSPWGRKESDTTEHTHAYRITSVQSLSRV